MERYVRLSRLPNDKNEVNIIANKTKNNYVNLGGVNSRDAVDCVHYFMCKHNIWDKKDNVVLAVKDKAFVPDPSKYHDISFVITFYEMACKSKEAKEKMEKELEKIDSKNYDQNVHNSENNQIDKECDTHNIMHIPSMPQPIVKTLTNPNIKHFSPDHNVSPNKQQSEIVNNIPNKKRKNDIEIIDSISDDLESIVDLLASEKKHKNIKDTLKNKMKNIDSENNETSQSDESGNYSDTDSGDSDVKSEDMDCDILDSVLEALSDDKSSDNNEYSSEASDSTDDDEKSNNTESQSETSSDAVEISEDESDDNEILSSSEESDSQDVSSESQDVSSESIKQKNKRPVKKTNTKVATKVNNKKEIPKKQPNIIKGKKSVVNKISVAKPTPNKEKQKNTNNDKKSNNEKQLPKTTKKQNEISKQPITKKVTPKPTTKTNNKDKKLQSNTSPKRPGRPTNTSKTNKKSTKKK